MSESRISPIIQLGVGGARLTVRVSSFDPRIKCKTQYVLIAPMRLTSTPDAVSMNVKEMIQQKEHSGSDKNEQRHLHRRLFIDLWN